MEKKMTNKFQSIVERFGTKEVKEAFERIEELMEIEVSPEKVEEIEELVKNTAMGKDFRKEFERRIRVLKKRSTAGVPKKFGALVYHLRKSKGYTLKDVANLAGISASYISRIEHGERKQPGVGVVKKLADVLGDELLGLIVSEEKVSCGAKRIPSVEEVLATEDYMVDGKVLDAPQKDMLAKLLRTAFTADTNDFSEIQVMRDLVSEIQESLRA